MPTLPLFFYKGLCKHTRVRATWNVVDVITLVQSWGPIEGLSLRQLSHHTSALILVFSCQTVSVLATYFSWGTFAPSVYSKNSWGTFAPSVYSKKIRECSNVALGWKRQDPGTNFQSFAGRVPKMRHSGQVRSGTSGLIDSLQRIFVHLMCYLS